MMLVVALEYTANYLQYHTQNTLNYCTTPHTWRRPPCLRWRGGRWAGPCGSPWSVFCECTCSSIYTSVCSVCSVCSVRYMKSIVSGGVEGTVQYAGSENRNLPCNQGHKQHTAHYTYTMITLYVPLQEVGVGDQHPSGLQAAHRRGQLHL